MKTRWIGLLVVAIVAIGIVGYKLDRSRAAAVQTTQHVAFSNAEASSPKTEVILVADLSEANEKGDNCAEIIRLVRDAGERGIQTKEFSPDSDSPLIKLYHVLTLPTVLVLDDGKVVSRYEGESSSTVQELQTRLNTLNGSRP